MLCIVRLRATTVKIPAAYKQQMKAHLDSICAGTKLRICLDSAYSTYLSPLAFGALNVRFSDPGECEEVLEEDKYEREFAMT